MSENVHVKEQKTAAGQRAKSTVQGTVSSFYVKGEKSVKCVFCNSDHFSAECSVVTELKERKNCLLKSGRCFNCLSTKYIARYCDRKRNCKKCGGSHHQSNCEGKKVTRRDQGSHVPESHDTSTMIATTTQKTMKTHVLQQMARTNTYVIVQ